ncbi:hypothetical protein V1515DRAFT_41454 [Lipomyces mesembrius]
MTGTAMNATKFFTLLLTAEASVSHGKDMESVLRLARKRRKLSVVLIKSGILSFRNIAQLAISAIRYAIWQKKPAMSRCASSPTDPSRA